MTVDHLYRCQPGLQTVIEESSLRFDLGMPDVAHLGLRDLRELLEALTLTEANAVLVAVPIDEDASAAKERRQLVVEATGGAAAFADLAGYGLRRES